MRISFIYIFVAIFSIISLEVSARCLCNDATVHHGRCLCSSSGTDYCSESGCPGEYIARPTEREEPLIHEKYLPIPDTCTKCSKRIVQPAVLPKCSLNHNSLKSLAVNKVASAISSLPALTKQHPITEIHSCNGNIKAVPLPADAVSVGLVQRLGYIGRAPVSEEKLQYGFFKKPLNLITRKDRIIPNVPEERLYSINRAIIELKKKPITIVEEIEEEPEPEEEEHHHVAYIPNYLTYKQIGFGPEEFHDSKFTLTLPQITDLPKPAINLPCPPELPANLNCGFQPGDVVEYSGKHFDS